MKRLSLVLITSLTAPLALILPAAGPAVAVTYVEVSASDVTVTGDDCRATAVRVAGDWDLDPANEIVVDVHDPEGQWSSGDYWYDEFTGEVVLPLTLCGGADRPGRWTAEAVVTSYDEALEVTGTVTASASFTFTRLTRDRSAIRRDVRYRAGGDYPWKVPGQLVRAGRGYARQVVSLQARADGTWLTIDSARTARRGKFGWNFKPNRFRWRYVYEGNRTTLPSRSTAFRTPSRSSRPLLEVDPARLVSPR